MPVAKRPNPDDSHALVLAKKSKNEIVLSKVHNAGSLVQSSKPKRTSNMDAPIMLLTGHEGEIYCARFHPNGEFLASAGFERCIFLWKVYGECENFHVFPSSHGGAIVDLQFSADGSFFYTASTDKTVGIFNVQTGERVKRLKGHTGYVNSINPARRGNPLIVSGSDDCSIKIWDQRHRGVINTLNSTYQVTAVSFNDAADQVISAGIDNLVKVWDTRKSTTVLYTMPGHTDTVTGMSLSPDGAFVLTNSMDNTLRIWDVRPYAPQERCTTVLTGHTHNFEKNLLKCTWSPDGGLVSAGSSDRFVNVWDTESRRILYKLPGHLGSVNDVDFHKLEPIILSAGSDKQIYLGEVDL